MWNSGASGLFREVTLRVSWQGTKSLENARSTWEPPDDNPGRVDPLEVQAVLGLIRDHFCLNSGLNQRSSEPDSNFVPLPRVCRSARFYQSLTNIYFPQSGQRHRQPSGAQAVSIAYVITGAHVTVEISLGLYL